MNTDQGVSIIVLTRNGEHDIHRLLQTFLQKNTCSPVEFIIVDNGPQKDISDVMGKYAKDVFIRYIKRGRNFSFAESNNFAAGKSRLPYLLFLNSVTGAFLLCQKSDFDAAGGFCREHDEGFEDIDFCRFLESKLNRKCYCINDAYLRHKDKNEGAFKRRMEKIAALLMHDLAGNSPARLSSSPPIQPSPAKPVISPGLARSESSLNIFFVLPDSLNCSSGYRVQQIAKVLHAYGAECLIAVPEKSSGKVMPGIFELLFSYIQEHGLTFSNGKPPDIIHAWTPREIVRKFVDSISQKYPCPVIIHMEENEEYLTEVIVGKSFFELEELSEQELDRIIPDKCYHPARGKKWLKKAQGMTMIIDTLERFNYAGVPSLVLPSAVDESLFYPRPLNVNMRKELGIPEDHVALAYTGNVHAGNRVEVRELYRAVKILNEQGCSAVLIRTGINAVDIGNEGWITAHEKNLGWVERSRVPDIMAAADVLVQPGAPGHFNDQRIPSKLSEYFAMGRPVILPPTNLGLKVEHMREGYVLDKADGESIAQAVMGINKDRDMAGKIAAGGVAFCRTRLEKLTAQNIVGFYRELKKNR